MENKDDYFANLPKNQKEAAKSKNRKDSQTEDVQTKEGPPDGMA